MSSGGASAPDGEPRACAAKPAGNTDDLAAVLIKHVTSTSYIKYKDAKKLGRRAPFQKSRIVAVKPLMVDLRQVSRGKHFTGHTLEISHHATTDHASISFICWTPGGCRKLIAV